jgi:hypothetical protein
MKALKSSDGRFEAFPDPSNNWIVWDHDQDDFAEGGLAVSELSHGIPLASILLVAKQTLF